MSGYGLGLRLRHSLDFSLTFYGSTPRKKVKARFFLDIISEKYHFNYFVSLHHLVLGIPDHFDLISDPYRDSYFGCS